MNLDLLCKPGASVRIVGGGHDLVGEVLQRTPGRVRLLVWGLMSRSVCFADDEISEVHDASSLTRGEILAVAGRQHRKFSTAPILRSKGASR